RRRGRHLDDVVLRRLHDLAVGRDAEEFAAAAAGKWPRRLVEALPEEPPELDASASAAVGCPPVDPRRDELALETELRAAASDAGDPRSLISRPPSPGDRERGKRHPLTPRRALPSRQTSPAP